MEYAEYLAQLTTDTGALSALLATADLTTQVRSCPGWSLADLGYHVAGVYQHKIAAMRTAARPDPWPPEPLPELWQRPVPEFLAANADELLREFSNRAPTQACWTWLAEDQTVGFWARRMAQETVIHLWDAQDAVGLPAPIGDRIAADGIDELLVAFLSGDWSDEPQPGPYGTVEICAGPSSWFVGIKADKVTVRRLPPGAEPEVPADAAVADAEQGMLLALWGRRPLPAALGGGQELVDALRARLTMVTQ